MKKIFSLVAVALAAITINAQGVYQLTAAPSGNEQVTSVPFITMTWGNDTYELKTTDTKMNVVINDSITFTNYVAGKANPDPDYSKTPTLPTKGTYAIYSVRKDGKLNIACCINKDKKLYVIESVAGKNTELAFTVTDTAKNVTNLKCGETLTEKVYGYITFDVKKGSEYYVFVTGSKLNLSGFFFDAVPGGKDEPIAEHPAKPTFSAKDGIYYDPFKIALNSNKADKIMYSLNKAEYVEYKDSIAISEYDKTYEIQAYSVLGEENSDTVKLNVELKHFIARPAFKAETVLNLANLRKEDIQVLSGDNGEFTEYTMDGEQVPALNYKHLTSPEGGDSLLILGFKNCPGLTIQYKNSEPKANVFKFGQRFLQIDSKNSMFFLEGVHSGDTIVIVATAKGTSAPTHFDHTYSSACYLEPFQPEDDSDPNFTDGDIYTAPDAITDNDYSGYTNLVYVVAEGGHSKVRIKETGNGARIAKILVNAYRGDEVPKHEAVENVMGDVKVTKTVENGQLVIIKNGVRYSAMGAAL